MRSVVAFVSVSDAALAAFGEKFCGSPYYGVVVEKELCILPNRELYRDPYFRLVTLERPQLFVVEHVKEFSRARIVESARSFDFNNSMLEANLVQPRKSQGATNGADGKTDQVKERAEKKVSPNAYATFPLGEKAPMIIFESEDQGYGEYRVYICV